MEVLKPNLLWIGGRCYRSNEINDDNGTIERFHEIEAQNQPIIDDDFEDELNSDLVIENVGDTSFKTSVIVPSSLFKFIIGIKGCVKKRIENETNTRIIIPRAENAPIVVKGDSKGGIVSACNRIAIISDSSRQKLPFTHFISIPLTNAVIKSRLEDFKSSILMECHSKCRGIDESIFQNVDKFHLTIATLVLLDDNDRKKACDLLEECKEKIIKPKLGDGNSYKLEIKGLEYMNDDPADVDVLYAKVSCGSDDTLQILLNQIVQEFWKSGLMIKQFESVKIHATVMNSLFRDNKENDDRKNAKRQSFDAKLIMEKFLNFNFGETDWNEVHISQRYNEADNGYYKPSVVTKLRE